MRLIAIEIEGFKSFAGRTNLAFGAGVTGIVGPNGSGKSNVAEAIRWVLGEQSMKALRGKERTDIIYSGSHKQSRKARVSLTFDNQSLRFPLQANEVTITRTLARDGESTYSINGEAVRLIDLTQMLAQAGIGTKSYTVISQGTVDQYLNATPEGRKELFNEATGIKSLQIKIAQSEQKIRKTEEHAQEVRSLLAELSPRLVFLQRQVDRYEEREVYMVKFRQQQILFYHAAWHRISQSIVSMEQQRAKVTLRISRAREHRMDLEQHALKTASTAHEKREYVHALEQFEAVSRTRTELMESLSDIRTKKHVADEEYAVAQKNSAQYDLKTILQQCKEYFEQVLEQKNPSEDATKKLLVALRHMLSFTNQNISSETPQLVLARLSAIEEERVKQLSSLPTIEKPSAQRIQEITDEYAPSKEDAEHARQEELQAEREGAMLTSSHAQTMRERQSLQQEIARECGSETFKSISTHTNAPDNPPSEDALRNLAEKIATIGERDDLVLQEHKETKDRHMSMQQQLYDVEDAMKNIQHSIAELSVQVQENFARQFSHIQNRFAEYFSELFGGGTAHMMATEEGVDITVTPPNKRTRHIGLLSGGEKALTSIALLLAILDAQQPPFIVLDEVDAALDEANSNRFATILKAKSTATQSIIISHNRETMSQADLLYGVTMNADGISTVYSVKIEDYADTEGNQIHT